MALDKSVRAAGCHPGGRKHRRDPRIAGVHTVNTGPSNSATVSVEPGEYVFAVRGHNAAGDGDQLETERVAVWDRDAVDEWMFAHSVEEFLSVRAQNRYPYSFDSDLCSPVPVVGEIIYFFTHYDELFADACKRHDFGYQNYGKRLKIDQTETMRDRIDLQLLEDTASVCLDTYPLNPKKLGECTLVGAAFAGAVSVGASSGFEGDHPFIWSPMIDNPEPSP